MNTHLEMAQGSGLPIVVDIPAPKAGMGFDRYVAGVAAAIQGGNPARYTVGLFGPWGSGKSSLLAGIADTLQVSGSKETIVVRFDAWRYQSSGSLVFALLQTIKRAVEQRPGMAAAAGALTAVLDRFEVSFLGVGLKYQRREPNSNEQFITPFDDLRKLSATLEGKRVAILVDDLDRCAPDSVVSVVEAIHLLTDVDGFVFVLALDYDYLIAAIEKSYEDIDAHRFIEKIVQIPFRIPHVNVREDDMRALLPEWETRLKPWFTGVQDSALIGIIYLALRSNPRQVKRLVNTYLLAQHMAGRSPAALSNQSDADAITSHHLLHLLAMQLAWPLKYEELTRAIRDAALSSQTDVLGDVGVYQDLVEADESDWESARLSRFLRSGLDESTAVTDLLPTMDLTASVAMTIAPSNDTNVATDAVRQENPRLGDHNLDVDNAPAELQKVFRTLESFGRSLDLSTTSRANKSYITLTRATERFKNRVFATLEVLSNRVLVNATIEFGELPTELQREPIRSVNSSRGPVAVRVYPDDLDSIEVAKRLIKLSFDRQSAHGGQIGRAQASR